MVDLLQYILEERLRQDKKWGEQDHGDLYWLAILTEEQGELAREIIENGPNIKKELVQVAAVAVAWLEALQRRYGDDTG